MTTAAAVDEADDPAEVGQWARGAQHQEVGEPRGGERGQRGEGAEHRGAGVAERPGLGRAGERHVEHRTDDEHADEADERRDHRARGPARPQPARVDARTRGLDAATIRVDGLVVVAGHACAPVVVVGGHYRASPPPRHSSSTCAPGRLRVRLSIQVTTAADTMQTPTTHSPSRLLPVASDSSPVTYGADEPGQVAQRVDQRDAGRRGGAGQVGGGQRPEAGQRGAARRTAQIGDRDHREPRVRQVEGDGDRQAADERGHGHAAPSGPAAGRVQTIIATSPTTYGIALIRPCSTVPKVVPYCCAKPLMIVGRKKPSA